MHFPKAVFLKVENIPTYPKNTYTERFLGEYMSLIYSFPFLRALYQTHPSRTGQKLTRNNMHESTSISAKALK